jgi:hypothetical protein
MVSSQTCLKRSDVLQIVDIEEDRDPWKEQAELSLNVGALVLAGAPDVAPARSTQPGCQAVLNSGWRHGHCRTGTYATCGPLREQDRA